jgi:hypothetical protein
MNFISRGKDNQKKQEKRMKNYRFMKKIVIFAVNN